MQLTFNDIIQKFTIPDKTEDRTTTSLKFKLDVFEYFYPMSKHMNLIELGSMNGQMTRVYSEMFKKVYAVDYVVRDKFKKNVEGIDNIEFIKCDLYGGKAKELKQRVDKIDVTMVDAVHDYRSVMSDTVLAKHYGGKGSYVIFDDYGAFPEVKKAIDDIRADNIMVVVKVLGHPKGWSYKEGHKLKDWEGVICRFL